MYKIGVEFKKTENVHWSYFDYYLRLVGKFKRIEEKPKNFCNLYFSIFFKVYIGIYQSFRYNHTPCTFIELIKYLYYCTIDKKNIGIPI